MLGIVGKEFASANILIVGDQAIPPSAAAPRCLEHPPKPTNQSADQAHTANESPDERALLERRLRLEVRSERPATETERQLIRQTLPLLYEFVSAIGGTPKQIDADRIHFYDVSGLDPAERALLTEPGVKGAYRPLHRSVLIFSGPKSESPLETADTLVHETLHAQAFSDIEAASFGASLQQRVGIRIIRPNRGTTHFKNLDEAVITTLTIRFLNQYGNMIPVLADELQRRTQFIEALPEGVRERARRDIARIVQTPPDSGAGIWRTEVIPYSYPKEREKLNSLIAELLDKNANDFADAEEVFQVFVQAVFTGRLLTLARLVEKTYGRGSFRRLGEQRDRVLAEHS